MELFGGRIEVLAVVLDTDIWIFFQVGGECGGDLSDNLDSFNAAVRGGASLEEATLATFTGKMSSRAGFSNVEIVELRGMPGKYTNVGALFR